MKNDNKEQQVLRQLASIYQPGTLNLIGGRPGMGKSTVAYHLALAAHQPTLYVSLEMSRPQLLLRYTAGEWIHIDDTVPMTTETIWTKVRQLQETDSIRWVIIDYLQLMRSSHSLSSRTAEVMAILENLKTMAAEQQVAVIVLTQVTRRVEQHADKKPTLQDICDVSSTLPSCVDDIRFLFRPDYYHIVDDNPMSGHNICEILSTECRHNDLGDLYLPFSEMLVSMSMHKNIQKQTDIAQLRSQLASVEEQIIRYTQPFDGGVDYGNNMTLRCLEERAAILNRMFELHCTEAEVRRFEHVNQRLLEVTNQFCQDCQQLRQQLDQQPYSRRMALYSEVNYTHNPDHPQLFAMGEDDFYGSHWNEMLWALEMSAPTDVLTIIDGETNQLDDGLTWAEGPLAIPQLGHVCVCFLAHALCTHLHYSIPDLLRMTTYCCEHNMWNSSEAKI